MKNFKILFAVAAMFMFSQTSFAQDEVVSKKPTKEIVTDGNAECVQLMKKVERRFKNQLAKRPDRFETDASQMKLKQRLIERLGAQDCYSSVKDTEVTDEEPGEDTAADDTCAEKMFKEYMANKRVSSEELGTLRKEFMQTHADKIKENCN